MLMQARQENHGRRKEDSLTTDCGYCLSSLSVLPPCGMATHHHPLEQLWSGGDLHAVVTSRLFATVSQRVAACGI